MSVYIYLLSDEDVDYNDVADNGEYYGRYGQVLSYSKTGKYNLHYCDHIM